MLNAPKHKGRPALEPRIVKLESEFNRLQSDLDRLRQDFALMQRVTEIVERAGDRQAYKPAFDKWPGQ